MGKITLLQKLSIFKTIYFNFKYLPLKQALKLPIFIFKGKLLRLKGDVIINSSNLNTGMIRLGSYANSLYPDNGFIWENHGGKVIFNGKTTIGNGSAISIGPKGVLTLGNNFKATTNFKLACYHSITIGHNALFGWENILMDTSFHRLKSTDNKKRGKAIGEIVIGNNNWITTRCMVMKGTKTPDYCILGAGSIISKDYSNLPTHILLAGSPLDIKATNIWRDDTDDFV